MTTKREYTGGSVSYYKVDIADPISGAAGYTAECNDIIEALGMNYAEGNAFKAIWRSCAAKTLGVSKEGYTDGLYDAEKVKFFGGRMVAIAKGEKEAAPAQPAYTHLAEVGAHMTAKAELERAEKERLERNAKIHHEMFGMTEREKAQRDDGWIEWGGGVRPIDGGTKVAVRMRGGEPELTSCAFNFKWEHAGPTSKGLPAYDIIAYRVVGEQA